MVKLNKKSLFSANKRGIFKEYQFYLCIKTISIPGYLPSGQYLKLIQNRIKEYNSHNPFKRLPTSQSQISRLVNKIIKLGFARRNRTGIYLNSYNKVYQILDADNHSSKEDANTFIEDFYSKSIKSKLKTIRHATLKAHPELRAIGELKTFLSCHSIANMFGFNSRSYAYKLRSYLEGLGHIVITNKGYRLLGTSKINKHWPGCFKFNGMYFYKPSSSIKYVL